MGMNRKYSGFTLVEMLIVMGIIIILMAVGIAAGRFAINRANDVAHQNAADQIFVAAQAFLTDNREYPLFTDFTANMTCEGIPELACVQEYLSLGEFRGGTDATYYYWTNSAQSAALVCVSLGGHEDEDERGFYCTGNGFSSETSGPGSLTSKDVDNATFLLIVPTEWNLRQNWLNSDNAFALPL